MTHIRFPTVRLYAGSRPTPFRALELDDVDQHRRVHCRRYGNCVEHAVGKRWDGFSCVQCPIVDPLSYDGQQRDLEGLTWLLQEVMTPAVAWL